MSEHEFSSMEDFLIFLFEGKFTRKRLHNLNLEDIFKEHPLDLGRYNKIKAFLKAYKRWNYDALCARFGIETPKLSYKEFAAAKGISEKKAEMLFADTERASKDFTAQLYYMVLPPALLRRFVFETQLELHNMAIAYDWLTGKDTAHEHNVGVCDEAPLLGRDLFNLGYDTLEEIQRAEQSGSPLRGRAKSIETSNALTQYGLNNTLWRGVLQTVYSGDGGTPMIYAIEDYEAVKIFFREKKIDANKEAMKDALNGLVYNNNCSGYDLDRLCNGDIWVYFNPTYHTAYDRRRAIDKIVDELKKFELYLRED